MAKARMVHQKISRSIQVNNLSLPARLLFTWMIAHADDEGRLPGEDEYIKATVVPMTKWSFKRIHSYIKEMIDQQLIYYWEQDNEWIIEFTKWREHQSIQKDRFKESTLPSHYKRAGYIMDTNRIQDDSKLSPQSNINESNSNEVNKTEVNNIADDSYKKEGYRFTKPSDFKPSNEGEVAAYTAWEKLEPSNPYSFGTTYLYALKKGLPPNLFYQFTSEIKQDLSVNKPGAVFNKKVDEYLAGHSNNKK